jgi:3-hydroxybutyryl-CoA dehydratase
MKKKLFDIKNFHIGQKYEFVKFISPDEVIQFSKLSGDTNPIHTDEIYAENSRYKKRIVHGTLIISYFSRVFGMSLPGNGCTIAEQNIYYKRPVYVNSEVKIIVEISKIDLEKRNLYFNNICLFNNKIAVNGSTKIFLP